MAQVETFLNAQADMLRMEAAGWSASDWLAYITVTLTIGPCGHPCSCVVEEARQQLTDDARPEMHALYDAIDRAMEAGIKVVRVGEMLTADAEKFANDKPPF